MTKRARGGSNWWDEGEPKVESVEPAAETATATTSERRPADWANLVTVVFKRCAFLEDVIIQRKREGQKVNFYETELRGIVWLLEIAGIEYQRRGHHGMDPEKIAPEPEPERPSAMADALAKAAETAENAKPFLEAACRAKISYSTEEAARRAMERLATLPDHDPQNAYPCSVCRGWHLTSLDPERSDLARKIVESRRRERPLPMDKQQDIIRLYRKGSRVEEIADKFGFPRRAVVNVLCDAGYSVAIATDAHRDMGLDR